MKSFAGFARGGRGSATFWRFVFWTFMAIELAAGGVDAQQLPGLTQDQLQQLQQRMQGQGGSLSGANSGVTPQQTILEPNVYPSPQLGTSRLEQILSMRAGVKLMQFGYDQLGIGRPVTLPQMGAVQSNYILGPGDEIVVTLRGQENSEYRTQVDRDGMVTLPRLSPIAANGLTLADFQRDMVNAIHRAYVATEGYVTVGRVRQVSILVSGEVNSPGVRTLTGLSTPVDALLVSGGVKKTGSLRNVYILRGEHRISVDLYSVLTGRGETGHVALTDGDRIVVPPLGPTAAVAGWVRRSGIYEIAGGRSSISVSDLLSLAGGLEVRGKYRLSVLRVAPDGRNQMTALERQSGAVGDSEILFVQPAANQTVNQATLSGGTALAGQYSIKNTKLSELLKSPGALGTDPYTLLGVISRRDSVTLMRTLIAFAPVAILRGSDDMDVQSDDVVRVLSAREARLLFMTISKFEKRRAQVDEALRNPDNMTPDENAQAEIATASPGATPSQQQVGQALANINAPHSELSSETESESLKHVEREIEIATRTQNLALPSVSNAQQNPNALQDAYTEQDAFAQLSASGMLNGSSALDAAGTQNSQNGLPQSELNNLQRSMAQTPQQIGPYRDTRSLEPPTVGQNLEEQSVAVGQVPTNQEVSTLSQLARQLSVDPVVLVNFLRDHKVMVGGAVREAGLYLVGPDTDIRSLLQAAGDFARWADKSAVEVTSTQVDPNAGTAQTQRRMVSLADAAGASYIVSPHDEVRVNEVFTDVGTGSVVVQGQVRNAGTYQIVRGEHLSELLMRAGGLTQSAYPFGTVFLRRSAAERERDAFHREATEIEDQLLLAMSSRDPTAKLGPDAFTAVQGYVIQLKNQKPLGRVTVAADPAVLAANPSLDPLLEPGDIVFIPSRPYSVAILGEVLEPGSVPFRTDLTANDYIDQVGGYSQFADKSETFLVLPDGSARRIESSWFDFGSNEIPPGSTIFVAKDMARFDLRQIIMDTTQIFSQLATTAAALAVLSKQ